MLYLHFMHNVVTSVLRHVRFQAIGISVAGELKVWKSQNTKNKKHHKVSCIIPQGRRRCMQG
jgi:hypothetical protein